MSQKNSDAVTQESFNFEKAFARLEAILDRMNATGVALDESLKLYEEADKLIAACSLRLNEAEGKIEMLIKKREGGLELNSSEKPLAEPFQL
jgi:exodeoxyribonuclease VII small subunit